MPGALDGVKVLDVGLLVQGPQAAALLCDMGADVTKIELPGMGDHARFMWLSADDQRSAYFDASNRGKRGVTVDLRTPSGAQIFKRMVTDADILISNFKPGTMDEWGLGYEQLRQINPGLIWAAGSAFGAQGPDAEREGADLAGQCAGGLISTIGADGEGYTPVGVTIADHIASQHLASGVLGAYIHKLRTGEGQKVEVSLLGGQVWAQASEYTHYFLTGELPGRANGGHPLIRGIYGIFPTRDGHIGIIGVPPAARDAFFIAMEHPELALDPRFAGVIATKADMRYLRDTLKPILATRTTTQWCDAFREMGVRYAPVRNYADAAEDPQLWENGYLCRIQDDRGEQRTVIGSPLSMSATPMQPGSRAPDLGEHTEQVLRSHGYSDADIARFRDEGAI